MNPVIEAIKTRRSVRSYTGKRIPHEVLETLIEAAIWAPNGGNQQQWRFVVVESPEMMARCIAVADAVYKGWFDKSKDTGLGKMRAEVDERLELGEDEKLLAPIVFGYPKEMPEPPPRKAPVVKWL